MSTPTPTPTPGRRPPRTAASGWPGRAACDPAGDRDHLPAGDHQRAVHPVRRGHADLRGRGGRLEPVLRLLRVHLAGARGVLRQRGLHGRAADRALEGDRRHHLLAAAAGRAGVSGDRGAVRADRAAGPAAHVRGGHHRDLLHLPAAGVQPVLHRREPGRQQPVLPVDADTYNNPFYYVGWARRRSRSFSLCWSRGPGSACSCWPSGTTRTGRVAWACARCG